MATSRPDLAVNASGPVGDVGCSRHLSRLAAGVVFGLGVLGIAACQPNVPGLTIETGPSETFEPSVRITMTTARSLTVRCDSAGMVEVNDTALPVTCAKAGPVLVYGSPGNDNVDLDLRQFPDAGCAYLGDGDDTARLRHRGSTDPGAIRVGCLWGGAGNDDLRIGFDASRPYRTYPNDASSSLQGGPGNDRLTDLGYLSEASPGTDGGFGDTMLFGGTGSDTLVGADSRPTDYLTDLDDRIVYGNQPREAQLDVADDPTVLIHNNGNHGTRVTVDRGALHRLIQYPTALKSLAVHVGGGNSTVTIDHKSTGTALAVTGDSYLDDGHGSPGTPQGNDVLILHPRNPYRWNPASGSVTQHGAQPWAYTAFATVTLDSTWP